MAKSSHIDGVISSHVQTFAGGACRAPAAAMHAVKTATLANPSVDEAIAEYFFLPFHDSYWGGKE